MIPMKNQENEIEKIDKYLNGGMNADEMAAFEDQIQQDENLRDEVALHHDIKAGIGKYQESYLKKKLQEKEAEIVQNKAENKPKSRRLFFYTVLAAGLSFLIVAFFGLFSRDNNQALYAEYYQPYPNVISPIDRSETSAIEQDPFQLYESGEYEEAIRLFEQRLQQSPDPATRFYLGISYMETEKVARAIDQFALVAETNNYLSSPAHWYLGLSYLRQGEREKAKGIFEQLATSTNDFQEKAKRILEEL